MDSCQNLTNKRTSPDSRGTRFVSAHLAYFNPAQNVFTSQTENNENIIANLIGVTVMNASVAFVCVCFFFKFVQLHVLALCD